MSQRRSGGISAVQAQKYSVEYKKVCKREEEQE